MNVISEQMNDSENNKKAPEENQLILLQEKIRSQAKRLCSLQEYISLCEKRLKQYNPDETFPLMENNQSSVKVFHQPDSHYLNRVNYEDLYNELSEKYNNLYESVSKNKLIQSRQSYSMKNEKDIPSDDIYLKYNYLSEEIKKMEIERKKTVQLLKAEMITNDEQRNQIEILKQAIETSLIKTGLKSTIDLLNSKYYPGNGEGNYSQIILDVSQLKEKNDELTHQCAIQKQLLEEADCFKTKILITVNNSIKELEKANAKIVELENNKSALEGEVQNQLEMIDDLNDKLIKSNNNHQAQVTENKLFENKVSDFKMKYEVITQELNAVKETNNNQHINILNLNQEIKEIKARNASLNNQLLSLTDFEYKYNELLKENFDIKKINQTLSNHNNVLLEENDLTKSQLSRLNINQIEEERKKMYEEICNLKEQLIILQAEKNKNESYFLSQIESITQERNSLENILMNHEKNSQYYEDSKKELFSYKSDNKKLYDKTKKLQDENVKYASENQFYSKLIVRIIKNHIVNLNVRNLILELISLNEKMLLLSIEKAKQTKKGTTESVYFEKEVNDLFSKIILLDKELKQYE